MCRRNVWHLVSYFRVDLLLECLIFDLFSCIHMPFVCPLILITKKNSSNRTINGNIVRSLLLCPIIFQFTESPMQWTWWMLLYGTWHEWGSWDSDFRREGYDYALTHVTKIHYKVFTCVWLYDCLITANQDDGHDNVNGLQCQQKSSSRKHPDIDSVLEVIFLDLSFWIIERGLYFSYVLIYRFTWACPY